MRFLITLLSHVSMASLVMRRHHMMKHSLLTLFVDSTPGGSLNVLLQEDGTAILQENNGFIVLE